MPLTVKIIRQDGASLDINDDITYHTSTHGLYDAATYENIFSSGYQRGTVYVGATLAQRQFSLAITILAGMGNGIVIHEATHNAARDQLITFLPFGELITVRTEYLGTTGYWDIQAVPATPLQEQEGTSQYICTLIAPDPALVNTVSHTVSAHLDTTHPERTLTCAVGGNIFARPHLALTPTTPKSDRWNFARLYTITNNRNVDLHAHAFALPFNFQWHITNGYIQLDGRDIRVSAQNRFVNFWFGNFAGDSGLGNNGLIWVELDVGALASVDVLVLVNNGDTGIPPWDSSTGGPTFDRDRSSNAAWRFDGIFLQELWSPKPLSWYWHFYLMPNTLGLAAIQDHLGSPWAAGNGIDVNVAGGVVPAAQRVQGWAGLRFAHPLYISSVTHQGNTRLNPALIKLVLRGINADGTTADLWTAPATDTSGALTAYGPITTSLAGEYPQVAFIIRSLSVHDTDDSPLAGADVVTLTISTPPTVVGADSGLSNLISVYMLEATVTNDATGEQITLQGLVTEASPGTYNSVEVDFDQQLVTMAEAPWYAAFRQTPPIRQEWLRLRPLTANNIRVSDTAVDGLDVLLTWQDRRV